MNIGYKPDNDENKCFSHLIYENIKFKPKGQKKEYCAYDDKTGGEFIYQYITIQKEATAQDVLNAIIADVNNVIRKFK